jgi:hypothetical protein
MRLASTLRATAGRNTGPEPGRSKLIYTCLRGCATFRSIISCTVIVAVRLQYSETEGRKLSISSPYIEIDQDVATEKAATTRRKLGVAKQKTSLPCP